MFPIGIINGLWPSAFKNVPDREQAGQHWSMARRMELSAPTPSGLPPLPPPALTPPPIGIPCVAEMVPWPVHLIRKKVLVKDAAEGRSASYSLARIK